MAFCCATTMVLYPAGVLDRSEVVEPFLDTPFIAMKQRSQWFCGRLTSFLEEDGLTVSCWHSYDRLGAKGRWFEAVKEP